MESSADAPTTSDLELGELERELLAEEARLFRDGVHDPAARERWAALLAAVEQGTVPSILADPLENLLELGLESGRLRRRYRAEGEQALLKLFERTSRGAAVRATTREANRALEGLNGSRLEAISFTARAPGAFGLVLETDRGRFAIRIQREGVWLESVDVDL